MAIKNSRIDATRPSGRRGLAPRRLRRHRRELPLEIAARTVEIPLHVPEAPPADGGAGDRDEIQPSGQAMPLQPEGLAQQPLRAVALDGAPEAARRDDPEPRRGAGVGRSGEQEEGPGANAKRRAVLDEEELAALPEASLAGESPTSRRPSGPAGRGPCGGGR
jgi:hypothetical protein